MKNMLAAVKRRLPAPSDRGFIEVLTKISEGADVPFHTLLKIAKGQTEDPKVSTVQKLFDYFNERKNRAAA